MNLPDPLVILIDSLSGHEHRKLKNLHTQNQKFLGKKTANAYLYETIRKKKPRTSAEVTAAVGAAAWAKNLAVTKKRLKEEILTILVGEDADPAQHLAGLLARARVLRKRGLPADALKVVEKALILAEEFEEFQIQLDLIQLHQALIKLESSSFGSHTAIKHKALEVARRLSETTSSRQLFLEVMSLVETKDYESLEEFGTKCENSLKNADTVTGRVLLHRALANVCFYQRDMQGCKAHYCKIVELVENSSRSICTRSEVLVEYPSLLLTLGEIAINTNDAGLLSHVRKAVDKLKPGIQSDTAHIWGINAQLDLLGSLKRGSKKDIRAILDKLAKEVGGRAELLPIKWHATLLAFSGLGEFYLGNFSSAVRWLHLHFSLDPTRCSPLVTTKFLLTFLVAHYHLGNTDVILSVPGQLKKYLPHRSGEYQLVHLLALHLNALVGIEENQKRILDEQFRNNITGSDDLKWLFQMNDYVLNSLGLKIG